MYCTMFSSSSIVVIHAVTYQAAELGEGKRAAVVGSRAGPSMGQRGEGSWAGLGREQRGEGSWAGLGREQRGEGSQHVWEEPLHLV